MERIPRTVCKLTERQVAMALKKGVPATLDDGGSLILKIKGPGCGTYYYRGRVRGSDSTTRVHCGQAPDVTLAQARVNREKALKDMQKGINPNEEREAEVSARRHEEMLQSKTFAVVAEEYFSSRRDLSSKHLQTERGRIRNHTALLSDTPVVNLRRLDLKPVLDELVNDGCNEQARRVAGVVHRVLNFAVDAGYIENNPADRLVNVVPKRTRGERNHFAAQTEEDGTAEILRKLWAYMALKKHSPQMRAAMKITCYLPIRNGNLIEARWVDIDFDKGIWKFPDTKNHHPYELPLSNQLKKLLQELSSTRHNQWCFPSGSKEGHISNTGLVNVMRMAGVSQEAQSLHGFRSTFQTLALEHGLPKNITERILFHVAGGAVEQAYNKARYLKPIKYALQWWADTVDALRQGQSVPSLPEALKVGYR